MSQVPTFRLDDPIPTGRAVIEASAGTGKTYAIAGLVTRLLAGDDPTAAPTADQLLVVTFTRAAAAELRARIRKRLAEAAAHLSRERELRPDDLLRAPLMSGSAEQRAARLANLQRAVVDLDSATIGTIHAFCAQLLRLGGIDGARLDDDRPDDTVALVHRLTRDRMVRLGLQEGGIALLDRVKEVEVRKAVTAVLAGKGCRTVPDPWSLAPDHPARVRSELVLRVVDDLAAHRRRTGTLSFDDQLQAALALVAGDATSALAGPVRQRYRAVLIDEFQDTDPVQWDVFDALFPAHHSTRVVVVGDPKQSIYAFRGADVEAYRAALRSAADRRTLDVNRRSDAPLVAALNRLFAGASFGPGIRYHDVTAAADHQASAITHPGPPLEIRHLPPYLGLKNTRTDKAPVPVGRAEARIDADVTETCVALLESGTQLRSSDGELRPLAASDVAILVATNAQARSLQARLAAAGVTATLTGSGSVFATTAARHLRWLLDALERPSSDRRVRGALLGWFLRPSPAEVLQLDDASLGEVQERLLGWTQLLERRGVTALLRTIAEEEGYPERLLADPGGERCLTDVDHLAELLHGAWLAGARRPTELLEVLTAGQVGADDRAVDEATRRVDTDDQAVVITTVHASKGLEYPVVLVPHLWKALTVPTPWVFHPEVAGERLGRTVDLASKEDWRWDELDGVGKDVREGWARDEDTEESFRDLYVALTRARHRVVVWWPWAGQAKGTPPVPGSATSPLGRLLWCVDESGRVSMDTDPVLPAPPDVPAALVARLGPEHASVVVLEECPSGRRLQARRPAEETLDVARLGRSVEAGRRRWSFTALAASSHHDELPPTEPDPVGADDEADAEPPAHEAVPVDLPFEGTPGGTAFGTVVHSVLEHVDFAAADLRAEVTTATADVAWAARWTPHRPAIVAGLERALMTSLGAVGGHRPLAGTTRAHRLDELTFDLSLPDAAQVSASALGGVLVANLPAHDPLRAYAHDLSARPGPVIAGYLTGSIDLLLRVPEHDRFVVVDYKTNHLHRDAADRPASAYEPKSLARAMARADYPLQALLYAVAAHRYLRWRHPGRPAETLVPAVAYLFLRGMEGAGSAGGGVFTWNLPAAAVLAASDVLAGGS